MTAFPVIEFRQYSLHPGARETLIDLFEAEFIESQEECGMAVIGQFRDLDDPDRFTWLRGFPSWEARPVALSRFYEGPVWAAHREAANATMIDSDDVHLLRPASGLGSLAIDLALRPGPESGDGARAVFVALLCTLHAMQEREFGEAAGNIVQSALEASGGKFVSRLTTLEAANNWPRLQVHTDKDVVMWLARFVDLPSADAAVARLDGDAMWQKTVADFLAEPAQIRRLVPTRRSALR